MHKIKNNEAPGVRVNNDDGSVSPKEVGHNIYILCHQLAFYNKVINYDNY